MLLSKLDQEVIRDLGITKYLDTFSEMKDFVATGLSYKAKPGQHDDLVSACLLMTRMMKVLADFDPKIFEKWTDRTSEITPMPIFGSFTG